MNLFKKIKSKMEDTCTERVKLCTPRFCACGCLDETFEDDYIIGLKDVEVTYPDDKDRKEHKDTMCICDEYIIAFEPVSKKE